MPTRLASASDSLEVREGPRLRGFSGPLLNAGGWLLYGIVWGMALLLQRPWHEFVAMNAPYILIGYLLSPLVGWLHDRLGVGPVSFGRSLIIIIPVAWAAGVLWIFAYYCYQVFGAPVVHSMLLGSPSHFNIPFTMPSTVSLVNRGTPGAIVMLGWSLLRLGVQYNAALRQQREQALRAMAAARDAQLRMLAYQLNPHFLFNTLNSIRALINEDRQRAREMVTALSGYLRYALVERPLHVALLEEEVASVRGYLAIEKIRFEERLDVHLEVEPAALRCEVPAFLLNPLVENAVKHGAGGTTDAPLMLRVEARIVEPGRLRLTVENTGGWRDSRVDAPAGRAEEDGLPGGVGLTNVRSRLAALHPGDHRIEIEEADGYVRVVVELPARFRSEAAT